MEAVEHPNSPKPMGREEGTNTSEHRELVELSQSHTWEDDVLGMDIRACHVGLPFLSTCFPRQLSMTNLQSQPSQDSLPSMMLYYLPALQINLKEKRAKGKDP